MKKKLKIGIPILALLLLAYLGYNVIIKMQQKKEVATTLQTIPNFSFKTLENEEFTNLDLKQNIPLVFIYFNSECDYCQYEAENIAENIKLFTHTQLLFVSNEPISTIQEFAENYDLAQQPNIKFLHDQADSFTTNFGANSIPFILIYDKNKHLIKKQKGQLKAEVILRSLQ